MPGQQWTREQDLAVLFLKVEYHSQLATSHPGVDTMDRTLASIWMRKGNFDAPDSSVLGVGLSEASKLTVEIWAEYERNPQRIIDEARKAYLGLSRALLDTVGFLRS